MAVAKVILNGNTLIDVTDKTVASSNLVSPNTALGADGTTVTGALVIKSASDVTVSGATTTIPAGVYSSQVQKTVSSGSATTPATSITANPAISVSSGGLITASVSGSQSVTPTVSAGYVSSGTAGTVSISGSNTSQLTVYNGAHHAEVSLISFSIELTTYQAEECMTWAQWCASSYNTDAFYVDAQNVMSSDSKSVFDAITGPVSPSDIINAANYILI